jgi:hypothetical protein
VDARRPPRDRLYVVDITSDLAVAGCESVNPVGWERAAVLETPGFQPLVAAAGGAAQVDAYYQRLVPDTKPASKNGSGTKNSSGTGSGSGTAKKPAATAEPSRPAKVKPSHPVTGRPTETGVLTGPPHAAPPPSPGGGHDR